MSELDNSVTNEVEDNSPLTKVSEIIDTVVNMQLQLKAITSDLKRVSKDINKMQKQKTPRRKPTPNPNRPKTGFAKPTKLSPDLCDFLGVSHDTEIARTEVTRLINNYIKDKSLQDPVNKRQIKLDEKLHKLLNPPAGEVVTYFTLQSYMKVHFISSTTERSLSEPTPTPTPTPSQTPTPTPKSSDNAKKKVVVRKKDKTTPSATVNVA